jgi:hypothetical protein
MAETRSEAGSEAAPAPVAPAAPPAAAQPPLEGAPPPAAARGSTLPRTVWEASGGTRIALSFVFLVLVPFYASIGPMLYQRISRGLVGDTIWLGLIGLAFTAIMVLILSRLIYAVRGRVELGETAVKLVLPAVRRGPFTLFRFNKREIPYADITAIDTRSEVYGGTLAPVMLTSTRLTTKDGQHLVLGYNDRLDRQTIFPFPEIGAAIAERAGTRVNDHGAVQRSISKRISGALSSAAENVPLDQGTIERINTAHARNVKYAIIGLVVLVVGGIAIDVFTASRTGYASLGAWGGEATPDRKK